MNILHTIFEAKRKELAATKVQQSFNEIKNLAAQSTYPVYSLHQALIQGNAVNIIAEVKLASPTEGNIDTQADVTAIAQQYVAGGAAALSVVTEQQYFHGNLEYLQQIREVTQIPLLRKDFLFDAYQVYEAKAYGANAILLIATYLDQKTLKELSDLAYDLNLEVVFEAHTVEDIEIILHCNPQLIGINARDFNTMNIDLKTLEQLVNYIPHNSDIVVVAESGIYTKADIEYVSIFGAKAVLVGTSVMRSQDRQQAVRNLTGVMRPL